MRSQTKSILEGLRPESVFEPSIFSQIKYEADFYIENQEMDGAIEYAHQLQAILQQLTPRQADQIQKYRILFFWLYKLKLFGFSNLSLQEQTDIFRNEITQILALKLSIQDSVLEFARAISDPGIFKDFIKNYQFALSENENIVGEGVKFSESAFNGTVKEWLESYRENLSSKGAGAEDFGAFHILNFTNNNKNFKVLKENDREILKSLLELFNWLNDPIIYADKSELKSLEDKYISVQKFNLPVGSIEKGVEPPVSKPALPNTPVTKVDLNKILSQGGGLKLGNSIDSGEGMEEARPKAPTESVLNPKVLPKSPGDSQNNYKPLLKKPVEDTRPKMDPVAQMGAIKQNVPLKSPFVQKNENNSTRPPATPKRPDTMNPVQNPTPGATKSPFAQTEEEDLNSIRASIEAKKKKAQKEIDKKLQKLKEKI